jgi:hypothetical protein
MNISINLTFFYYSFKVNQSDDMGKLKNIRQLFPVTKRPGKNASTLTYKYTVSHLYLKEVCDVCS